MRYLTIECEALRNGAVALRFIESKGRVTRIEDDRVYPTLLCDPLQCLQDDSAQTLSAILVRNGHITNLRFSLI